MQIGTSIYLDIEIIGTDYKNFLTYADVMSFTMVETAGASLPYIGMKILVRDDNIKNSFQQNNRLKISVGNNATDAESFEVTPLNVIPDKDPSGTGWSIDFAGFIGSQDYMLEQRTKSYWGNSLFVVNKVMKEYFGKLGKNTAQAAVQSDMNSSISSVTPNSAIASSITSQITNPVTEDQSLQSYFGGSSGADLKSIADSGIVSKNSAVGEALDSYTNKTSKAARYFVTTDFTSTNENQVVWRQNNTTACYFIANTLLHSDLRPSFPLFSFDRYLNFYIRDLGKLVKKGPSLTFTPLAPKNSDEIRYYNNFNVDSFKPSYNLYSGYNKVTEIFDAVSGIPKNAIVNNEPILAATSEAEKTYVGNIYSMNNVQSANVHKNYNIAFAYNSDKLISLSSMLGILELHTNYYKNIHPTDFVNVQVKDDDDPTTGGNYLVDTVVTTTDFASGGFKTYVYVTRDNKNNVENYVPRNQKRDWLKVKEKFMTTIIDAVSAAKSAYAQGMRIIDGRFMQEMLSFILLSKNNVLRSFRIAGVNIDFTLKENLITSLIAEGNSLLNTLFDMVLPRNIATSLRDVVIRERTTIGVISNYVDQFVPSQVQSIVMTIVESLFNITDSLNSIAKDNGIVTVAQEGRIVTQEVSETDVVADSQQRVNNIINSFVNNTTGLDIPFPIIDLTESQALMTDEDLTDFVANETVAKLDNLGYFKNLTQDEISEFKSILTGDIPINFNIINKINKSAGDMFAYKYWGTYNSVIELTSFYIKKSFKDKYRTIPCTKLISATQDTKIFFACPSTEEDLKFYINSKRVDVNNTDDSDTGLGSFEIDLGYGDAYGNPVLYTVYYTKEGFNSNSVVFEVKQGGMV